VNRHTSSRPVGMGWSARSKDATGCRWLATFWDVSTACATAGWSVTVTNYRFRVLTEGVSAGSTGGEPDQPTAPSICSSMSRFSSRAYSIGSSFAIGSTKPRTIIAIASSSSMPRLIR
jgi:hypothetical protein